MRELPADCVSGSTLVGPDDLWNRFAEHRLCKQPRFAGWLVIELSARGRSLNSGA